MSGITYTTSAMQCFNALKWYGAVGVPRLTMQVGKPWSTILPPIIPVEDVCTGNCYPIDTQGRAKYNQKELWSPPPGEMGDSTVFETIWLRLCMPWEHYHIRRVH